MTTMTQPNTTAETTTVSVTPNTPKSSNLIIPFLVGALLIVLGLIITAVIVLLRKYKKEHGAFPYTCNICKDVEQGQGSTDEKVSFFSQPDVEQGQGSTDKKVSFFSQPAKNIVKLAAFAEGLHALKECGILIITGHIGSGKTTALEEIIRHLQQEDSEWKVKDISFLIFGRSNSSNDKLLIKWDDCFGKFVANPVKKKNTMEIFKEISKWVTEGDGNRKCILTMRENEFIYFNVYDSNLFRTIDKAENNKVCLDNLSDREKDSLVAEISKKVCSSVECSDNHMTKITKELMGETESVTLSSLGRPLICRLAAIPYIAKNINYFMKDPVRCIMSLFDTLRSTDQQLYCAMIYVLFKGGKTSTIDTTFLKEVSEKLAHAQDTGNSESTDDSMKFSCNELDKIFHKQPHYFVQKDEEYFFHHEVFLLWLLCHFYQRFPETTIEHFDLDILIELLRPNNYIVEGNENYIEMLCSFVPKEKHDNQTELEKGDEDEKPVQCEEDIMQRAGFQTISSNALEGKSENQSWKFTLEEKLFSCFIKRVVKEKEDVQKLQVEKEQSYGILEGHPLLEDSTFMRIYSTEETLIRVQDSE